MCDGYRVVFLCTFRFVINSLEVVAGSLRRFHLFSGTQKCRNLPATRRSLHQICRSLIGRNYPALRLSLHSSTLVDFHRQLLDTI